MIREQALKHVKRLNCLYEKTGSFDNSERREEYIKAFLPLDNEDLESTIDVLSINNKFCPSIAGIYELYKEIESNHKQNKAFIQQESTCYVCMNDGFIINRNNKDDTIWIYYCTECEKGQSFKYQGKECKNHKSKYTINPITELFDQQSIEHIKSENMFKNRNPSKMPENVRQEIQKAVRRMTA